MMICVTIDLVWFEAALFYGWGKKTRYPGSFGKTSEVIRSSILIWPEDRQGMASFTCKAVPNQPHPCGGAVSRVAP
jgi:hypothetical protein